jgi:rod shape-determining protein MreC
VQRKQIRRRRAVLALLVVVSLILLTEYFGESPSSPLHSVQRGIAEVLSPIQQGASTVLSPVRDVAGWFSDTFNARSRADRLQKRVDQLTQQLDAADNALIKGGQNAQQVQRDALDNLDHYKPVSASVIGRDPTLWYATVEIDKGSADGVHVDDPVLADGALAGKVSTVGSNYSFVTLLTDHTFAVAAEVLRGAGDTGVMVPKIGDPSQMLLQYLSKPPPGQLGPSNGDQVVTAGFAVPHKPQYGSLYPPNIPIGTVADSNQNDLLNNGQVTVRPLADLRHFSSVQVLTSPDAGGLRAQVPTG